MNQDKKKMNTTKLVITFVIVSIVTAAAIFTVSFSFITPLVNRVGNQTVGGVSGKDVSVQYLDGLDDANLKPTETTNLLPGETYTKYFRVVSSGNASSYDLYIKHYKNTFQNTSTTGDISYVLYKCSTAACTSTTTSKSSTVLPFSPAGVNNTKILSNVSIASNTTHYYKMVFTYINRTTVDQEVNRYAYFDVNMGITEVQDIFGLDNSGANRPQLVENLISVIYDEDLSSWVKADTAQPDWYNYSTSTWANAVTVVEDKRSTLKMAKPGAEISMDDITGMFVWIPRYEYKIVGDYGVGGTSATSPGSITIKFITASKTVDDQTYRIHPAFIDGSKTDYVYGGWNKELSGFWYGKFATTIDSDNGGTNPVVKPGIMAYRRFSSNNGLNYGYGMFNEAKTYSTQNGLSMGSHMSKNDEWGAVAYLTQSVYGHMENGSITEIYPNKYSQNVNDWMTGKTGCNSAPSASSTIAQASSTVCNSYDTSLGVKSSTTNNIYGIYDMSASAVGNDVMAFFESTTGTYFRDAYASNSSLVFGAADPTQSGNSNGWTTALWVSNLKDNRHLYNAYNYMGSQFKTACNGNPCYGHAMSEVDGWYSDYVIGSGSLRWVVRASGDMGEGLFSMGTTNAPRSSYRMVLAQ